MKRFDFLNPGASAAIAACIFVAHALLASNVAGAQSTAGAASASSGDPAHGKSLYQGCASCHSIDENDIGPKHRGVVGRKAGSIPDYAYSPALKNSGVTWDEVKLNQWLVNPSAMVPGTKMFFKIDDAQSRADIIAYLKQLK